MYLKMMSEEDLPDEDPRKSYTIVDNVEEVRFARDSGGAPFVQFTDKQGAREDRPLHGNAYVINEIGGMIDAFGYASPYEPGEKDDPVPNEDDPMGFPFGPSGGPIPGETPPVCGGLGNLGVEPFVAAKSETDYQDQPPSEKFELLRIPDSDDVVIRDKTTGEGAVLAGEGETSYDDQQGPNVDTFEALEGCYGLMAQAFEAIRDAGLIVPKDALDAKLHGEDQKQDRKLIRGHLDAIRRAENDKLILRELVYRASHAHYEALVAAAVFCAVSARRNRNAETGQEYEPSLKPVTVKVMGHPDHVGTARLSELQDCLNRYLKTGNGFDQEALAMSALRLYAWEDKVVSTDTTGDRALENLRNVADSIFTA